MGARGRTPRSAQNIDITTAPTILAIQGAVLASATWLTVATRGSADLARLTAVLHVAAAALFVGAGLVRIARWRITSESRSGLMGAALVVFGTLALPLSLAAAPDPTAHVGLNPAAGFLATLAAAVLVVAALRAPTEDPQLHPLPIALGVVAAAAAGFLLMGVERRGTGILPAIGREEAFVLFAAASAAVWAGLACATALKGRRSGVRWTSASSALLATLALSHAARALSPAVNDLTGSSQVPADALLCSTGLLVLAVATIELRRSAEDQRLLQEAMASALGRSEDALAEQRQWHRTLGHDGQNAMAALRMTLSVLDQQEHRLDPGVASELRASALAEIAQLETMLRGESTQLGKTFQLAEVLAPILESHRACEVPVRAGIVDAAVCGVPDDLAVALQNLLCHVRACTRNGHLTVDGSCDAEVGHVLLEIRGHPARTSAATSSTAPSDTGIGLFLAHRLVSTQGGELEAIADAPAGCGYVVTLPLARDARWENA